MEVGNKILDSQSASPEKKLGHQVERTVSEGLEQEKKPGEPKISIHILFAPHGTEKDIEGFEEKIREADIFIPEVRGWTAETLHIFRKFSEGKLHPKDVITEGESKALGSELGRIVYDSHKPITIVDLPWNHPLGIAIGNLKLTGLGFGSGCFEQNLTKIKDYFKKSADLQRKREEFMSSQIMPKIQELLGEQPFLKDKKEIHVIMLMGSAHTSFFDLLKSRRFDATKTMSKSHLAFISPFHLELGARYVSDEPVSDDLLARVAFEMCCEIAFLKNLCMLSEDSLKVDACIAKIVSQFNFEEIKGMFEGVSRFDELVPLLISNLHKKGIRIPRSQQEMNDLLAKPLPRETAD